MQYFLNTVANLLHHRRKTKNIMLINVFICPYARNSPIISTNCGSMGVSPSLRRE